MNDIVLEASVVNVEPQTEVLVDAVSDAEAVVLDAVVRLENNEFVLSSGGMYGSGALVGTIPAWVLEAVNQKLTTGDGNITGLVNDLQTALDALETGVNQSISNLESDVLSQSGLITSLRSDVDGNNATIMNVLATKVTEAQASAVALSAIQSKFGDDVEAFVSNIASTYVDADSAIASEIDMMQASLNGVSASITDISSITIETVQNPLWVDDGLGTDPDINDEPRWIDQAKAKKQLEVNADGVITGLLLESGQTSSVTVQSDEFKLVATGQSVASRNPFTVNATTGDITFVGKVSFNSVTDVPALGSTPQQVVDAVNAGTTTTIDGGKITTGTITAGQIAANTIATSNLSTNIGLVNGYVYSSNFNGNVSGNIGTPTAGFRLSSNAAGTETDPTIYGAYIKGGTIDSSTMNVRNINVISDYLYGVLSVFSATSVCSYNGSCTYVLNLYAGNSTSTSKNKLSKSTGNAVSFFPSSTTSWATTSIPIGWVVLFQSAYTLTNTYDISIKVGDTTISTYTGAFSNGQEIELNGIGFKYFEATVSAIVCRFFAIREINTNVIINSTDNAPISIVIGSTSQSGDKYLNQLTCIVDNLT